MTWTCSNFQYLEAGFLFFVFLLLGVAVYNLIVIKANCADKDREREFIYELIAMNQKLRDENSVLKLKIRNWERGQK